MNRFRTCILCQQPQRPSFTYRSFDYCLCPQCGLVSTYPYPDHETITRHYQAKFAAGNYQILRAYADAYLTVYEDFARRLELKMQAHGLVLKDSKILDVGCFTGDFLCVLRDRGADVYGEELQAEAVQIANEKLPGRVFHPDQLETALHDVRFDAVSLLGVIEHIPEPEKTLRRVAALLKPGGVLMIQTPNSASRLARILGRFWPPYAPVEHIHLFSRKSIEGFLQRCGFQDITFAPHWKHLPVEYVYQMLQNFGPEFHRIAKPFHFFVPRAVLQMALPFYGGEMILLSRKTPH